MVIDSLWLVVEHDDHGDDQYQLFADRDEAFAEAKGLASDYAYSYDHNVETYGDEGGDVFGYQGEERWWIAVQKITLKS